MLRTGTVCVCTTPTMKEMSLPLAPFTVYGAQCVYVHAYILLADPTHASTHAPLPV